MGSGYVGVMWGRGSNAGWPRWASGVAVLLASIAWFWRFQIAGGFDAAFGDAYDAMIEVALLEHWVNVLRGVEAWNGTGWFHPAPNTLGYNDAYLGSGLIYAAARACGLGMIAAAEVAHAVLKAIGFAGMFVLLRYATSTRARWSLFGAALFTIADVTLQHANHGQLFALGFAPWAAWFGWRLCAAIGTEDGRGMVGSGLPLGAVFALWIATGYYLAWFFLLYGAVLAIVLLSATSRGAVRDLAGKAVRAGWRLPVLAAAGVAMLLPFLLVYGPKARETGGHAYADVAGTSLWPIELVNVGRDNLLWSGPFEALRGAVAPGLAVDRDFAFGWPPLLIALAVFATWRLVRGGGTLRWVGLAGVAMILCWLLMLDLGSASPWRAVYAIVPGAGGIRVIGRFMLLLLVPAIVVVTVLLDRARGWPAMLAGALLLAEQVAVAAPVDLDRSAQSAMLAGVPYPPAYCRAFAVRSARPGGNPDYKPEHDALYAHNVDAMVLAARFGVPTINGVSSFAPPGWDFADPARADYWNRVRAYARRFSVTGLCALDMQRGVVWEPLG